MEIQKKYYDINYLSADIGKQASNIRFWEGKLPWLAPKVRVGNNRRRYQRAEMCLVRQVSNLIDWGMHIDGIASAYDKGYFQDLYNSLFILHKKYDGTIL